MTASASKSWAASENSLASAERVTNRAESFFYSDPFHSPCIGYRGLTIALGKRVQNRGFVPEQIVLPSGNSHQFITRMSPAPSSFEPGRIRLLDRHGNRREAWGFGGDIQRSFNGNMVVYKLMSKGPLFPMNLDDDSFGYRLGVEAEALFGRLRAAIHRSQRSFSEWMAQLSSLDLYGGTLFSVEKRYESQPILRQFSPEFYRMVLQEKRQTSPYANYSWLAEREWPTL